MKSNWINVVAAVLIIAGVFFLTRRPKAAPPPVVSAATRPSVDQIRQQVIDNISAALGRPLNDIEKQMISIDQRGNVVQIRLMEPLSSRYAQAQKAIAATRPGAATPLNSGLPLTDEMPTGHTTSTTAP